METIAPTPDSPMQGDGNPLEMALERAASEPAHRPEFYRFLLASQVYVLGYTDVAESERTISAGEKVSIVDWQKPDGAPIIPFFASLEALRNAIQEESPYMALQARALFEMTRGASLVLNPASTHGKEFFPAEIEALLSTGMNQAPQARVVKESTQVLLGQPAQYPSAMVSSLTAFLPRHPCVKAAYLCLMHDPSSQEKPALVVGFEGEEGLDVAMQEAGVVAADTAPNGDPVDFIRIRPGEGGVSDYFLKSVKPFYERSWGSKLKSLLGPGRA